MNKYKHGIIVVSVTLFLLFSTFVFPNSLLAQSKSYSLNASKQMVRVPDAGTIMKGYFDSFSSEDRTYEDEEEEEEEVSLMFYVTVALVAVTYGLPILI